jgi:hypothetical protein
MARDIALMKNVVKDLGASYSKQLVDTYLPVRDEESLKKLEEDLDSVEDLGKQLFRFLKSKDKAIDTVKGFDKLLDDYVIKMMFMETAFNWGQPVGGPKMPPLFTMFLRTLFCLNWSLNVSSSLFCKNYEIN